MKEKQYQNQGDLVKFIEDLGTALEKGIDEGDDWLYGTCDICREMIGNVIIHPQLQKWWCISCDKKGDDIDYCLYYSQGKWGKEHRARALSKLKRFYNDGEEEL